MLSTAMRNTERRGAMFHNTPNVAHSTSGPNSICRGYIVRRDVITRWIIGADCGSTYLRSVEVAGQRDEEAQSADCNIHCVDTDIEEPVLVTC